MTRLVLMALQQQGQIVSVADLDGWALPRCYVPPGQTVDLWLQNLAWELFGWRITPTLVVDNWQAGPIEVVLFGAKFDADHKSTGFLSEDAIRRMWSYEISEVFSDERIARSLLRMSEAGRSEDPS